MSTTAIMASSLSSTTASAATPPSALPAALLPAPAFPAVSARPYRWGILGAGAISDDFCHALQLHVADAVLQHVGARDRSAAQALASKYGGAKAGSYEDVCSDPLVDVVYVGTIHPMHRPHALLAIAHGKHVLVEKPFTLNAAEAEEVIGAARAKGLFCMEAMKVRCMPYYDKLMELSVHSRAACGSAAWWRGCPHLRCVAVPCRAFLCSVRGGELGRVQHVMADLCFRFPASNVRIFEPALAGGALLDVGCYPLYLAAAIHGGAPTKVHAMAELTEDGVDGSLCMTLGWDGGGMAQCFCSVRTDGPRQVHVLGERGRITIADPQPNRSWNGAPTVTLTTQQPGGGGGREQRFDSPMLADDGRPWNGGTRVQLAYEAHEVHRCLAQGKTESEKMTCNETLALMRVMDDMRRQVGVAYPSEKTPP